MDEPTPDLQHRISELEARQSRLERSDRKQWARLKAQRKYTLIFAGLLSVGAFFIFKGDEISSENRAMLERIATAALAAGGTGLVGVQLDQFQPKDDDEELT